MKNERMKPMVLRVVMAGSLVASGCLMGCDNAGQGAMAGAGVGALSGLAIGSLSGNAGQGAAIGAVAGGVGGAVIGDQNRRTNQRADAANAARREQPAPTVIVQQPAPAPVQPPPVQQPAAAPAPQPAALSSHDRDRLALAKFARPWRVTGWETVDGQRRFVSGTATGQIDNTFFIRLDMAVTDEQSGRINTGNVVFASEPGRGLTMNSRFDTSPSPVTYTGSVSADGNLFTLDELGSGFGKTGRRMVIRFLSPDNWVADVTDRSTGSPMPRASMTFTAAR